MDLLMDVDAVLRTANIYSIHFNFEDPDFLDSIGDHAITPDAVRDALESVKQTPYTDAEWQTLMTDGCRLYFEIKDLLPPS